MMQYFAFINMTCVDEHGIGLVVRAIMKIELVFVIVSLFSMFFAVYLLFTTTQYHLNLSWIFVNFCAQYTASLMSKVYLITSQLNFGGENLLGTPVFDLCILIRTVCTLTCLVVYTGVIFERVLATVWVKDYETRRRFWIPATIIPMTYVASGLCTWMMYQRILDVSTIAMALNIVNLLDFGVTLIAYKYSKKRCYEGSHILEGVLSWRYQQEENYRSWELLRVLLVVIVFFNIAMGLCLMAPEYITGDGPHILNMSSLALDQVILLYGLVCPPVALYYNKLWQKEVLRILDLIGMGSLGKLITSNGVTPVNVESGYLGTQQQDVYFNQLSRDWETAHVKRSKLK